MKVGRGEVPASGLLDLIIKSWYQTSVAFPAHPYRLFPPEGKA